MPFFFLFAPFFEGEPAKPFLEGEPSRLTFPDLWAYYVQHAQNASVSVGDSRTSLGFYA